MGACAGSTGGGMKAMRILLIFRQGRRELKQLLHPNAVIPLKLDHRRVRPEVVSAVWSFFAVYMFSAFIRALYAGNWPRFLVGDECCDSSD